MANSRDLANFGDTLAGVSNVNIDSGTLFVDATNNIVGVGTATPGYKLEIRNDSNTATNWVASVNRGATGTAFGAGFLAVTNNTSYGILAQRANDGVFLLENAFVANVAIRVAGNDRIVATSTGPITMPYQPAFDAYGSGVQNWSGASQYLVLQLGVQVSQGVRTTGYNTGTYRFTAPVSGTYLFLCKVTQTTSVTGPQAYVFVNGVAVGHEITIGYSQQYLSASGFLYYYMNAGDYADLRVINNNNVTMQLDLGRCSFTGHLIG